jgi:hypothetical protein
LAAKDLNKLEHSIGPLLSLIRNNHPSDSVAVKAAMSIRTLIASRVNLLTFIDMDGMHSITEVFQKLLLGSKLDLKIVSNSRSMIEHCCVINREVGRFYPWKIVEAGLISHMVTILRIGDITLQSIAAATFSVISQDDEICKLLFTNGCVKPILNVTNADITNDACMMAGLGCIIQLCRVPEIGALTLQQGALPVLENAFNKTDGQFADLMREKALFALSWLSRIPRAKSNIASPGVLRGLKRELTQGTLAARQTVVQMLLNLHNFYPAEKAFLMDIRDVVLDFLVRGVWHVRNLSAKCLCVLYREPENILYFVDNGAIEAITEIMTSKSKDLQEAPMVALLSVLTHPDVPDRMWGYRATLDAVIGLLGCIDITIRNLAVVFIKAMSIYDLPRIYDMIPANRRYLFNFEDDTPELMGSEYEGLIQEYLLNMVDNRRDRKYLLEGVTTEFLNEIGLNMRTVEPYCNLFMELDPKCRGLLDIDGLKLVLISLGEEVEDELVEKAFKQYDSDGSGAINFAEFVYMMQDYKKKEGGPIRQMYNNTMNKGTIGRAKRRFKNWWNKDAIEKEQIRMAKAKREAAKKEKQDLAATHWEAEQIRLKREAAKKNKLLKREL